MNFISASQLEAVAQLEFADIVRETILYDVNSLRIILNDNSYIDLWFSLRRSGRFSFHWERTTQDDTIYLHDNAPDAEWKHIATFPQHFHEGSQGQVKESYLNNDPLLALREFLVFAHLRLKPAIKSE